MKNKLLYIIIGFLLLSIPALSKAQSGIYMNMEDYKQKKLTYESDCDKRNKIRLHDLFGSSTMLTIVHEGKKYSYKKSDVYGFKDCDNKVYRLYKNEVYAIAEAGDIYIYTQTENITQTKGFKVVNVYYFSAGADGEVLRLNMNNLKRAFAGNDKFLELLDASFVTSALSAYDELHKMYKVNYIFSKAK
jgi:hypothetical protein